MILSRRTMMGAGGATLASGLAGGYAFASPRAFPVGIQLYSVGDSLQNDFAGTLKTLAHIGYREIEASLSQGGRPPEDLARIASSLGLGWRSIHTSVPDLQKDADHIFGQANKFGVKYIICAAPWARDPSRIKPLAPSDPLLKQLPNIAYFINVLNNLVLDDWKWMVDYLNETGERARAAGLTLGYHNHHYEFKNYDGVVPYDLLLDNTNPAALSFELDCGWAAYAGVDAAALLRNHPNRFRLLHIKDLAANQPKDSIKTTEVGSGTMDWKRIFAAARATAVTGYYVEQEPPFDRPPLEAARISYDYLHKLRV